MTERTVPTYRVTKSQPPHPADGMTAIVVICDGAQMEICNPQSFAGGGAEWRMRYGDPEPIRYTVAALLSSYDALLSADITMVEATRRLRLLRAARRHLCGSTP